MTRGTADVQVSPNELGLNPTDLIAIYRDMFTARAVSERLWLLGRDRERSTSSSPAKATRLRRSEACTA